MARPVSDVPQSRHSLFMRGFSGNVEMGRIRDFFAREAGKCSFDFFKQSADGTRLFVAIRFESKATAQEMRDRFNGQEVLGCKLQISYFKDIRRWASHTGSMVNFNRPPMRNDFGPQRRQPYWVGPPDRYYNRGGGGGRPPQRNDSRRSPHSSSSSGSSSSRSPSDRRRNSRGHSDSPVGDSRKSPDDSNRPRRNSGRDDHVDGEDNRSRSNSAGSPHSRRRQTDSPDVPMPPSAPPPPPTAVPSDWEIPLPPGSPKGGEMVVVDTADSPPRPLDGTKRRRVALLPDNFAFEASADASRRGQLASQPPKAKLTTTAPGGNDTGAVALGAKFRPITDAQGTAAGRKRRRISSGEENDAESTQSDEADRTSPQRLQSVSDNDDQLGTAANNNRMTAELITSPRSDEMPDRRDHRRGDKEAKRRKKHRRDKSAEHHLQPLSRFAQNVADQLERKLKISGLTGDKLESLREKKMSLETGYKTDCETFLVVVKMLISKDPSLEDRILAGMRESLKDVGQKYLAELTEHVDQLLLQP